VANKIPPGGETVYLAGTEVERLYLVAEDYEADVLDHLREKAGVTWTHYGCWTNLVAGGDGKNCERCGKHYDELRETLDCSEVVAWEND